MVTPKIKIRKKELTHTHSTLNTQAHMSHVTKSLMWDEMEDRQRSLEEVDSLARSNKKLKDHHSDHQSEWDSTHSKPNFSIGEFGSYRDRLVGAILGAFE